MGGGGKRLPSIRPIILMLVFLLVLLLFRAGVRADDGTGGEGAAMTVTMAVEIPLELDQSDALHPVFSGSGEVYAVSVVATSHRYITVTLPDSFEMETPAGTKDAPEGTSVEYKGSMNARKGYENYKAKNGLSGMDEDDLKVGTIEVEIPLTADFVRYGEGEYSLTIPVELSIGEAYGSYNEDLDFTPWAELLSEGSVTVSGDKLTQVSKPDRILEIEPGIAELGRHLFSGSTYRDVWIPNTVTSGAYAMDGSGVETVCFEDGFTKIPDSICRNAGQLVGASVPEGVEEFGDYCFYDCGKLSEFTFPGTMTTLGDCAFQMCESLEEVQIKHDLSTGSAYFRYAPFCGAGIQRIVVGEGVTRIPRYLFYEGCASLTELTLPSTLGEIGYDAFNGAVLLKELTIRSNLAESSSSPFYGSGIETLTFAEGVTSIPKNLFKDGCGSLMTLNLPGSVVEIGASAFENAAKLKTVEIKNNISIGNSSATVSPFIGAGIEEVIVHEGVTEVCKNLFSGGCGRLTKLTLPSTLTFLGGSAFEGCSLLKKVELRSDVTIGSNTTVSPFNGAGLEEIVIADGVTTLPNYLFKDACDSLTSLTLPEGLVSIGKDAFSSCPLLVELTLPKSMGEIGACSFENCSSLKELHIRSDLSLPRYATSSPFLNSGLERIVVEEGVTKLSKNMFADGCAHLTDLQLPASLRYVEGGCFENCTSLTGLVIRSNIGMENLSTTVSSFENSGLTAIRFTEGVTEIGKQLFGNKDGAAITVYLPDTIAAINGQAFGEDAVVDVMFAGDEAQWEGVNKNRWSPASVTYGVQLAGARRYVVSARKPATDLRIDDVADGDPKTEEDEEADKNGEVKGQTEIEKEAGDNKEEGRAEEDTDNCKEEGCPEEDTENGNEGEDDGEKSENGREEGRAEEDTKNGKEEEYSGEDKENGREEEHTEEGDDGEAADKQASGKEDGENDDSKDLAKGVEEGTDQQEGEIESEAVQGGNANGDSEIGRIARQTEHYLDSHSYDESWFTSGGDSNTSGEVRRSSDKDGLEGS